MADPVTTVLFVQHHDLSAREAGNAVGGYEPGDTAGLPSALAADLIDAGIAVAATIPSPVPPASEPDPVAALAAAQDVIDRLGTGTTNPNAAAFLAVTAPTHFAKGKTVP